MKRFLPILVAALCLSSSAFAHHSMSAEFDVSKSVTMKGTICSVELSNPHTHIYVYVKLDNGQAETWKLELPGAARLNNQAVPRDTFKPGDAITIQAYASKTQLAANPTPSAFYSGCTTYLANSLRVGHVQSASWSGGKQLTVSDVWPETITIRQ